MEDYRDIKNMLAPRRDFVASYKLRLRINRILNAHTRRKLSLRWIWSAGASCVAVVVLLLYLISSGVSANNILTDTLDRLIKSDGVEMTVEVRTRPMENFRYIDLTDNFVKHFISIAKSDSTLTWRIDKGGRTAAGNDSIIYNWIEEYKIGWSTNDPNAKDLLGDMAIFLTPEKILEAELEHCMNNKEDKYSVSKKNGDIILSVHSKPSGDFSNPYKLNASIAESENIRSYVIDSATKHLKSASVSIVNGTHEIEVLRITDINYCSTKTNLMELPTDVRFIDMSQSTLYGLTVASATEAASAFLNALELWNVSILEKAIDENIRIALLELEFKGAVLLAIGESFMSGNENTTFVPYSLRLADGTIKRHNLALHKSRYGGWIVIGGL